MDLSSYVLMQTDYFDTRFGPIDIYYNPQDTTDIIFCKNKLSFSAQEHQQSIQTARDRFAKNFPYIMPLIHLEIDDSKWLIKVFFEYPNEDLFARKETLIDSKAIIHFFHDMLHATGYLEKNFMVHGNLRPEYIYFNPKNNRYILLDRLVDVSSPNQTQLNNIEQNLALYMSPVIFNEVVKHNLNFKHNPFKAESFALGMIFLSVVFSEEEIQVLYDVENKAFDIPRFILLVQEIRQNHFSEGERQIVGDFIFDGLLNLDQRLSLRPLKALKLLKSIFLNGTQGNSEVVQKPNFNFNMQSHDALRQSNPNNERTSNILASEYSQGENHVNEQALLASMKDALFGARFLSFCNFPGNGSLLEVLQAEIQKRESNPPNSINELNYLSEKISNEMAANLLNHGAQNFQDKNSKTNRSSIKEDPLTDNQTNIFTNPLQSEKQVKLLPEVHQDAQASNNFFGFNNSLTQQQFRESLRQRFESLRMSGRGSDFFKFDLNTKVEYEKQYQDFVTKCAKENEDNDYSLFNLGSSRKFITDDGTWVELKPPNDLNQTPNSINPLELLPKIDTPYSDDRLNFMTDNHQVLDNSQNTNDMLQQKSNNFGSPSLIQFQNEDDNDFDELQEQSFRESLRKSEANQNSYQMIDLVPDPSDTQKKQNEEVVLNNIRLPPTSENVSIRNVDVQEQLNENSMDQNDKALNTNNSSFQGMSNRLSNVSNPGNLSYTNDENFLKLKQYMDTNQDDDIDFLQSQRNVNKHFSFQNPQGSDLLSLLKEDNLGMNFAKAEGLVFKKSKFNNLIEREYSEAQKIQEEPQSFDGPESRNSETRPLGLPAFTDNEMKFARQAIPHIQNENVIISNAQLGKDLADREERKTIKSKLYYNSGNNNDCVEETVNETEANPNHSEYSPINLIRPNQKENKNSEKQITIEDSSEKLGSTIMNNPVSTNSKRKSQFEDSNDLPTTTKLNNNNQIDSLRQSQCDLSQTVKVYKRNSGYFNLQNEFMKNEQGNNFGNDPITIQIVSRKSIQIQTSERDLAKQSLVSDKIIQTEEEWQSLSDQEASVKISDRSSHNFMDKNKIRIVSDRDSKSSANNKIDQFTDTKNNHFWIQTEFNNSSVKERKSENLAYNNDLNDKSAQQFLSQTTYVNKKSEKNIQNTMGNYSGNEFLAILTSAQPIQMLDNFKTENSRIIVNKSDFEKKESPANVIEIIDETEEDEFHEKNFTVINSERKVHRNSMEEPKNKASFRNSDANSNQKIIAPKTEPVLQKPSLKIVEIPQENHVLLDIKQKILVEESFNDNERSSEVLSKEDESLKKEESDSIDLSSLKAKNLLSRRQTELQNKMIPSDQRMSLPNSNFKNVPLLPAKPTLVTPPTQIQEKPISTQKTNPEVTQQPVPQNSRPISPMPSNKSINLTDDPKSSLHVKRAVVSYYKNDGSNTRIDLTPEIKPRDLSPTWTNAHLNYPTNSHVRKSNNDEIKMKESTKPIVRSTTPNIVPQNNESKYLKEKLLSQESNEDPESSVSSKSLPMRSVQWVNQVASKTTQPTFSNQRISNNKMESSQTMPIKKPVENGLPIKPTTESYNKNLYVSNLNPMKTIPIQNQSYQIHHNRHQSDPYNQNGNLQTFNNQVISTNISQMIQPGYQNVPNSGNHNRTSTSPIRIVQRQNYSDKYIVGNPPPVISPHANSMQNVYQLPTSLNPDSRENSFKVPKINQPVYRPSNTITNNNGSHPDFARKVEANVQMGANNYGPKINEIDLSQKDLSKKSLPTTLPNQSIRDNEAKDSKKLVSDKDLVYHRNQNGVEIYRLKK